MMFSILKYACLSGIYACVFALTPIILLINRNRKVFDTRIKWVENKDPRYRKYSYESMCKPTLKNWFGFKPFNENDFQ